MPGQIFSFNCLYLTCSPGYGRRRARRPSLLANATPFLPAEHQTRLHRRGRDRHRPQHRLTSALHSHQRRPAVPRDCGLHRPQCRYSARPNPKGGDAPASSSAGAAPPERSLPVGQTLSAVVIRVSDGDAAAFRLADGTEETVRFIGVDTPEAGRFTKSQLTPGTQVQLELDAEPRDRYGRLLAYVWLNGEMFNRRLVAEGYAQPLRIASNVRYAAEFEALAGEARVKGRGLWGMCGVK